MQTQHVNQLGLIRNQGRRVLNWEAGITRGVDNAADVVETPGFGWHDDRWGRTNDSGRDRLRAKEAAKPWRHRAIVFSVAEQLPTQTRCSPGLQTPAV